MRKRRFVLCCFAVGMLLCACGEEGKEVSGTRVEAEGQKMDKGAETETESKEETTKEETTKEEKEEEKQDFPQIVSEEEIVDYGNVVRVGNQAFELYTYSEDKASQYAQIINRIQDKLEGKAKVYDLLVPTGAGILFPDNYKDRVNNSDQKEAIKSIQNKLEEGITLVNPYDNLMKHRSEYIYFRTDHHWTARGAYYAYETFCEEKNIAANPLGGYKKKDYDGFLGSFFKDTNEAPELKKTPDFIETFQPLSANATLHVAQAQGMEPYDWQIIHDVTNYGSGLKYSTFIAGDNPLTEITNPDSEKENACVVVKESYANAMIPFLVDHYRKIYVIDYRYWTGDLASYALQKNVEDVILINNLSMTRSNYLLGQLSKL